MAKLVVLSEGFAGRTHELKGEKITIGRLEDNTFQIPEPSVSSHHCEILVRGGEILVRDLQSTNGTFINGEPVTEAVLKPGQVLRLGAVELRLEEDVGPSGAAAPAPAAGAVPLGSPGAATPAAATSSPPKKPLGQTSPIPRGVTLSELESGARPADLKKTGFAKKEDRSGIIFWTVFAVVGLVIVGLLVWGLVTIR
jgi:predicted component of type VI protein secretion system